jgi:cytosine/adenosine deaminase-related metal-dependent hydrolase
MAIESTRGDLARTPGMVCAHHHLYSTLARGMPAPPRSPTNFLEILEQVWWRLDRALDADMIYWSAKLGALEALEAGTTAIIDHHSSPSCIEGSLDLVAEACKEVGVRVLCAYEVSERNGMDEARAGIEENARFLRSGGRGYVGAHACFTLSEATLEELAGMASDLGTGVHIHVAEDRCDQEAGSRLAQVASEDWLLAHCVFLEESLPGTVVHNPRSNMNNAVGYGRPSRFQAPVALGTDGIGADMLEEFRIAYARAREDDLSFSPVQAWGWLETGWKLVPEALGDEVNWSYEPMDPWYLAFTPGVHPIEVRVDGEVVLSNGKPTKVDGQEVRAKAREQARRLFSRL